jgi:DNA-binding response OmpR family regulator
VEHDRLLTSLRQVGGGHSKKAGNELNARIMVVENKTLLGRFITQTLSHIEHEVTSVGSVEETEARLSQGVDCLVLYAPQGASAWNEQVDAWRKLVPTIKIIVVSDNFSDKNNGATRGPDAQVSIPFEPEKLVQTVEKCLANPASAPGRKRRLAATA